MIKGQMLKIKLMKKEKEHLKSLQTPAFEMDSSFQTMEIQSNVENKMPDIIQREEKEIKD